MFPIKEMTLWTDEETVINLKQVLPPGWVLERSIEDDWHYIVLVDEEGQIKWSGEHPDLKILALNALGWFQARDYKIQHPVWKPRDQEVPLYRPPISETTPDPPDLAPDEVAAVYALTDAAPPTKKEK